MYLSQARNVGTFSLTSSRKLIQYHNSPLRHASGGIPPVQTALPRNLTTRGQSLIMHVSTTGHDLILKGLHLRHLSGELFERKVAETADICNVLYSFLRPHTLRGTAVSVVSLALLAVNVNAWNASAMTALVHALLASLLVNISFVGINQVFDVEADRVNKPYLPLASGEMSVETGFTMSCLAGVASLMLSLSVGSVPLFCAMASALALGCAYSADHPLLRWKRWPVVGALCIMAGRAIIAPLGIFYHMQLSLGQAFTPPTPPLLFTMAIMLMFSTVVALFKDLPDIRKSPGSLTQKLGVKGVYTACTTLLLGGFLGGAVFGASSPDPVCQAVTCVGHLALAYVWLNSSAKMNFDNRQQLMEQYLSLWKLMYVEYGLIALIQ